MTNTTTIASVATASSVEDRVAAMETVLGQLADAVLKLSAVAPAAPAPAPAPAAPAAPAFVALTNEELSRLTPQQKVQYMAACRAAYFGQSSGGNPAGVYGAVGGFVATQAARVRNASTHTLDVYAMERMRYLATRG